MGAKNIDLVGVVGTLPEGTKRGERFKFDLEKTITSDAIVPKHFSLNFYREVESQKFEKTPTKANFFHVGDRYQLSVRFKRPHSTYNPHGFDFASQQPCALALVGNCSRNIGKINIDNIKHGFFMQWNLLKSTYLS